MEPDGLEPTTPALQTIPCNKQLDNENALIVSRLRQFIGFVNPYQTPFFPLLFSRRLPVLLRNNQ